MEALCSPVNCRSECRPNFESHAKLLVVELGADDGVEAGYGDEHHRVEVATPRRFVALDVPGHTLVWALKNQAEF